MHKDNIQVKGHVEIYVNGQLDYEVDNLVVTSGHNLLASIVGDGSTSYISHMAVGDVDTAPDLSQTTLLSEIARESVTTSVTDNNVVYTAVFGAGVGTGALVEAGLFNDATAGDMLSRVVYPVKNKDEFDTFEIVWTITFQ